MVTNHYGRSDNPNRPIQINRMNEKELNNAIADLEERGFHLIKRGSSSGERKSYDYQEKKGQKFKYTHSEVLNRCWAVMQRS